MASRDRLGYTPPQFLVGSTYKGTYPEGLATRGDLTRQLMRETVLAQRRNSKWVDGKLERLREERCEPLLDVLVVSEGGEIISSLSTYRAYANSAQLGLEFSNLVDVSRRRKELVYPLTGERDATLFWHQENEAQVLKAIQSRFGNVDVRDYKLGGEGAGVRITNVQRGVMGKGEFATEKVIYGTLGFWVNHSLGLGNNGPKTHIERARFTKSRLISKDTFVSPLSIADIEERGGNLIDGVNPNVRVVRVDPKETNNDFITAAIQDTRNFQYPVVFRYAPIRPWMGEFPRNREN